MHKIHLVDLLTVMGMEKFRARNSLDPVNYLKDLTQTGTGLLMRRSARPCGGQDDREVAVVLPADKARECLCGNFSTLWMRTATGRSQKKNGNYSARLMILRRQIRTKVDTLPQWNSSCSSAWARVIDREASVRDEAGVGSAQIVGRQWEARRRKLLRKRWPMRNPSTSRKSPAPRYLFLARTREGLSRVRP